MVKGKNNKNISRHAVKKRVKQPAKRLRVGLKKERPTTEQDPAQDRSKT